MLSALAVNQTKTKEKPYKLTDGRGLYLLVTPQGHRYWRLEFDIDDAIWSTPAEWTKMRRLHRVPLSTQVLGLLEELRALSGLSVSQRPISRAADLGQYLERSIAPARP